MERHRLIIKVMAHPHPEAMVNNLKLMGRARARIPLVVCLEDQLASSSVDLSAVKLVK